QVRAECIGEFIDNKPGNILSAQLRKVHKIRTPLPLHKGGATWTKFIEEVECQLVEIDKRCSHFGCDLLCYVIPILPRGDHFPIFVPESRRMQCDKDRDSIKPANRLHNSAQIGREFLECRVAIWIETR